jgi:hypothetical protein
VKPIVQALVLAERVYQDITGKKIIAGTFNRVFIPSAEHFVREQPLRNGRTQTLVAGGMHGGSPYAYISLTDVVDGSALTLQFVNLGKNQVLLELALVVNIRDRLEAVEIVVPLPPLPITEPGTYALEITCEGEILRSHRIVAEHIPEESREGESCQQ